MTFNFTLPSPMTFIFTMGWLGLFMFIGVMCRARIAFLRKWLIPTAVIGGVLGMFANWTFLEKIGIFGVDQAMVKAISFHILPLFFSALAFRSSQGKDTSKRIVAGAVCLSGQNVFVSSAMYLVSVILVMGINLLANTDYLASIGLIVSNGFSGGPSSAMGVGIAWDPTDTQGYVSMGLTGGSLGFLIAYIVGIPLANLYHKQASSAQRTVGEAESRGYYLAADAPSMGRETTFSSNIEALAVHIGLIFVNWSLSLVVCLGVAQLISYTSFKNYAGMVWTFTWMIPVLTAYPLRKFLNMTGYDVVIDDKLMAHIGNYCIDLMVICSFFGMTLSILGKFLPVLLIVSVVLTVLIFGLMRLITWNIKNFRNIRVLYEFGVLTGTAATGLFLVRIVDPDGKNPMALEQAFASFVMTFFHIPTAPFTHLEALGGHSPWIVVAGYAAKALAGLVLVIIGNRLVNRAYAGQVTD